MVTGLGGVVKGLGQMGSGGIDIMSRDIADIVRTISPMAKFNELIGFTGKLSGIGVAAAGGMISEFV